MLMMRQGIFLMGIWAVLCVVATSEEVVKLEPEKKLLNIKYSVPNLFPEGIDWDAKHSRFLVGSMNHGKLVAVSETGAVEEFVKDEDYSGSAILGVKVDSKYNRVLAVVSNIKEARFAALVAYDLTSKNRVLYVHLNESQDAATSKVSANDVAVDGEGNAYVTNPATNLIWKVTLDGNISVLVELPQQPITAAADIQDIGLDVKDIGVNGIVYNKGYLIVGQSNSGALFRVNLADSTVQVVRIKEGELLPAADGLAFRSDGSLVVISIPTAWLLASKDMWSSASVIDKLPLDETVFTTSAAVNDMRVLTLHSHFPESFKGVDRDSFSIQEIEFPSDSYNNPLWLLAVVGLFGVLVVAWKCQMNQFNKEYTKKRV